MTEIVKVFGSPAAGARQGMRAADIRQPHKSGQADDFAGRRRQTATLVGSALSVAIGGAYVEVPHNQNGEVARCPGSYVRITLHHPLVRTSEPEEHEQMPIRFC
jgi:hypothetical protein